MNEPSAVAGKGVVSARAQHTTVWPGRSRVRHAWPSASSALDCACGINTQAIGLAMRGGTVHATDLSPAAIARAGREAASFGAALTFMEYVDQEQ
jgi:methylase of polypeptide subunit release factors